jgi:predicted O-methyltransferase YrrM
MKPLKARSALTPNLQTLLERAPSFLGFRQHFITLYSIVYGLECRDVLEVGAGYSTYMILGALGDLNQGHLTSVDRRPRGKTLDLVNPGGDLEERLTYIQGEFLDQIDALKGPYDLFLQDGTHRCPEIAHEVGLIALRMRQNGLILVHDTMVLANGNIFTEMPGAFEHVTLPYGYGLTIIRVIEDYGNGEIDPKWKKL